MKMKTGFITVVMSLVLLAILSGCCANGSSSGQNQSGGTQATASGSQGKVLVVFFSATGNTKAVAQMIAGDMGGTTFEITPKTPYTTADLDWSDANSRVSKEYADTSLRSVELTTTTVADWSSYDTVFIDMANLSTCRNPDLAARLLYVAFTRPRNRVIMYGDLVEKFGGIIV